MIDLLLSAFRAGLSLEITNDYINILDITNRNGALRSSLCPEKIIPLRLALSNQIYVNPFYEKSQEVLIKFWVSWDYFVKT